LFKLCVIKIILSAESKRQEKKGKSKMKCVSKYSTSVQAAWPTVNFSMFHGKKDKKRRARAR
jgi:hypothetical protein